MNADYISYHLTEYFNRLMRVTLVLGLCKLGLVTRTSRIRSKIDHAPLSPCLFSPAHASGSQNP
jgi:hypothetical protein